MAARKRESDGINYDPGWFHAGVPCLVSCRAVERAIFKRISAKNIKNSIDLSASHEC